MRIDGDSTGNEGSPIHVTRRPTIRPVPGSADAHLEGGPGSVPAPFQGSDDGIVLTPEDNGIYVITLTAEDGDGGRATATRTIAVRNVRPTAYASPTHGRPRR